jgi:hypothetical protein
VTIPRSLTVHDRVRSNDPRVLPLIYQVESITDGHARLVCGARAWTVVSLKRIHTDGKPRRSGWSVVSAETPTKE